MHRSCLPAAGSTLLFVCALNRARVRMHAVVLRRSGGTRVTRDVLSALAKLSLSRGHSLSSERERERVPTRLYF